MTTKGDDLQRRRNGDAFRVCPEDNFRITRLKHARSWPTATIKTASIAAVIFIAQLNLSTVEAFHYAKPLFVSVKNNHHSLEFPTILASFRIQQSKLTMASTVVQTKEQSTTSYTKKNHSFSKKRIKGIEIYTYNQHHSRSEIRPGTGLTKTHIHPEKTEALPFLERVGIHAENLGKEGEIRRGIGIVLWCLGGGFLSGETEKRKEFCRPRRNCHSHKGIRADGRDIQPTPPNDEIDEFGHRCMRSS
mmetsp:Transcript_18730/g.35601  ORF Transcript_18730/g.35601 Transcript_18730/m.35601 type:complete len:247 (-) Transcript_18730:2196-2936(-)